jgi:multidrug resistance efflux pump
VADSRSSMPGHHRLARSAEGCRGEASDRDTPDADRAPADRNWGSPSGWSRDHRMGLGRIVVGCCSPAGHGEPRHDTTTVTASGTIAAAQQASLNFGVSGQVTSIPATVGQQVHAGQTLATVDAASLPSQVAQARAAVAASQARVASDQASGASAAQINADNAALASSNAQLAVAQQNLSRATLTAPFDGTIAAVTLTVGQQVSGTSAAGSGGTSNGSGPTGTSGSGAAAASSIASATTTSASNAQIVVISTGTYVVNADVDDTQVSQLRTGDQAVIVPNGSTSQIFGTGASVGMVGSQSSGITTYPGRHQRDRRSRQPAHRCHRSDLDHRQAAHRRRRSASRRRALRRWKVRGL